MVCTTSAVFFVQPVPYWTNGRQGLSCGISLVFFSTFEPHAEEWHSNAVVLAASQLPTLYVCLVENVLCRVQLMQCYLKGNLHTLFLVLCVMQFPLALLPIPGQTAGQAAGFLRSTSGCGAMGEHSPERSQLRMLWRCGGSVSKMQDGKGLKP